MNGNAYHKSGDFIKRTATGLPAAYSTPNLHESNGPLSARSTASDDEYDDASTTPVYSKSLHLLDTVAEAHIAMNLFLNNSFSLAEERMAVLADRSCYHALGYGGILFLKAMMTCDRSDMEQAIEATRNSAMVINKLRAQYSLSDTLYRFGGHFKTLSDYEIHAELCYAEMLMLRAILTFFYDENLTSFIRGALRIRACYQSFKECQRILEMHSWTDRDPGVRAQFEAGARTGVGMFNLMLSTLPAKVLRLLEVVGFSGNKAFGMKQLHGAATITGTLRTVMARLVLLAWHLFVTYFIGAGQPDLRLCERLLIPLARDFPNGTIILFMRARLYLVNGDLENAVFFYNKSIQSQSFYRQFHHVNWWELLFAHCYMRKWDRAANYAKRLLDENKWSKCVYTFMLAILINADLNAPHRIETVRLLLERVPLCRLRIAGKSIPVEKFCERKAKRFNEHNCLHFAHYEFLYFWNGFSILESRPETFVTPILNDLKSYWTKFSNDDINDICLYEFLRGTCFRILKEYEKADRCFSRVIANERTLTDHFYLVPNAVFEMAMIRADTKRQNDAIALLNKARSYRAYPLENKLHFRIHAAMETLSNQTR
ncbi:hypothetical protein M3Y94_01131000 [Aphelenchoides besseyi]|nr:hypothetical protein M3Y94_01131000 [Aphelenchoides besseyi]KAI6218280.1 hypothetical protein M3Y95_01173300 [Aphelenchoides besseyi]